MQEKFIDALQYLFENPNETDFVKKISSKAQEKGSAAAVGVAEKDWFVNVPAWATALSRYTVALLKLHGLEYADLSQRLRRIGVEQTAANLRAKISKGTFGAQLFLQIIYVLDEELDMARIVRIVDEVNEQEAARIASRAKK